MEKNSFWWVAYSRMVLPWSNKVQCSLREVRAEGHRRERVIFTEEDLARFCLSQISWTDVAAKAGSLFFNGYHIDASASIHRKLFIHGVC